MKKRILSLLLCGLCVTGICSVKANAEWYQSEASKEWFYLDENGNNKWGWIQDNGNWYFESTVHAMQKGWMRDRNDGIYYHFDETGKMDKSTPYFEFTDDFIHDSQLTMEGLWEDTVLFGEFEAGGVHVLTFYPSRISQEDFISGKVDYIYVYYIGTGNVDLMWLKQYELVK